MKYRCFRGPLTLPIFLFLALISAGQPARAQSSAADRARLLRTESAFQTPNNVSAEGVARCYHDFLDMIIVDTTDAGIASSIRSDDTIGVEVAGILMHDVDRAARLAEFVIEKANENSSITG